MKRALALVVAALLVASSGHDGAVAGETGPRFTVDRVDLQQLGPPDHPSLDARLAALAHTPDRHLPDRVEGIPGFDRVADTVSVVLYPETGSASRLTGLLRDVGATEVRVLQSAVLAIIPVGVLTQIADSPSVRWVGASPTPIADISGQGVATINAPQWFSDGYTGAGSKVAIIDLGFDGYETLLGSELPSKVHTFDRCGGGMGAPEDHGTAVAEIVHEVAPHATLYLMCVESDQDLAAAVDYSIAQGATVINHSVGWIFDHRLDGTGPITEITLDAFSAGVLWVNSAGNYAEHHWGGTFDGQPVDVCLDPECETTEAWDFNTFGTDPWNTLEVSGPARGISVDLRWDDWTAGSPNNYDLWVFAPDGEGGWGAVAASQSLQPPLVPWETLTIPHLGGAATYRIMIRRVSGPGTTPEMDLFVFGSQRTLDVFEPSRSVIDPATASWVLAVGASGHGSGADDLHEYSSQGPTITGTLRPDLTAPSRVNNSTYGIFGGTSASAPHTTGAAALIAAASETCSSSVLRQLILESTHPVGDPVPNNQYGYGRLLLDTPPAPPLDRVLRYAGANRYATAADISENDFPCGAHTVLVATGENFPDALAGAAVASRYAAPILLVQHNSIPEETADELERLAPDEIILLGGEAAVSATVETQLGAHGDVTRIAGSNRFATARLISEDAFPDPDVVDDVFLANGFGFADALTGGPTAAFIDGPLLLVNQDSIPAETLTELGALQPERVWILGGTAVVSSGVEAQLSGLGYTVERLAGSNRYLTAVAASDAAGREATNETAGVLSHRVYIAVGTNFPDALAGAGAAGIRHAPILLVQPNSIPAEVAAEIERLNPREIVILGGTGVVSAAVEAQLLALLS